MERANLIKFLASSADELISDASVADTDEALALIREAAELLSLGSALLGKNEAQNLSVIVKEAA